MKLLYVAHKIRDPRGPYYMQEHVRAAEAIALELWRMGAAVICPGKNTWLFDGALPDDVWLIGDMEIMRRCDAIVMAPGWTNSQGATEEHKFALEHNITVFEWENNKQQIHSFILGQAEFGISPENK